MTQEHAKYDQEVIYGTTYDTYIYMENLQQTRLCGARSGSPQLRKARRWPVNEAKSLPRSAHPTCDGRSAPCSAAKFS